MASILEFIRTGKLGHISTNVSKEEIENILGKPDDVTVSRKPRIYKYGSLQLAFYWDKEKEIGLLDSIHLYFDGEPLFPSELCLGGWIPDNSVSMEVFLEYILEHGINIKKNESLCFENQQIGYISDAKVTVVFNAEGSKYNLKSMHKSV